ncbi:MAG: nucleotide-binding protein [Candidatus Thiodiazotropha endolucinida]
MDTRNIELLDSALDELSRLKYGDDSALDAFFKRTSMLIRRICGDDSRYVTSLENIWFQPMYAPASNDEKRSAWDSGTSSVTNLINTIKEEITLFEQSPSTPVDNNDNSTAIFIVHGHDEELKQAVARTVELLGFKSVILHEKPNKGRTIIEKFDDYSDVGFAIALLSADDVARSIQGTEDRFRARQNVIFELGFFLGRLGRERVAAIFRPHESFELPSDYSGVIFIPYDADEGAWRYKLAKELKSCGFAVNVEAIL